MDLVHNVSVIDFRTYGTKGPLVIAVHGGPGATGSMSLLCHELSESYRVIEPFQRSDGPEVLGVALHIRDMDEVIQETCKGEKPILVGHSFGAMLSLAYAAEHPNVAKAIALVCCGTFDKATRVRMNELVDERKDDTFKSEYERLIKEPDASKRIAGLSKLMAQLQIFEPMEKEKKSTSANRRARSPRAFDETWKDMVRLQDDETYPAAFTVIKSPAAMLHGAYDPHPGPLIHERLKAAMPQLEYREWERCGHYPWLEKYARDDFFVGLKAWLKKHS